MTVKKIGAEWPVANGFEILDDAVMQKRSRTSTAVQEPTRAVAVKRSRVAVTVMAEMGSKGGKIGGKRRAANMTPEQRKHAATVAAHARWGKTGSVPALPLESRQKLAARKLAALFEEQLTDLGLSETEKDTRVAEFSAFVDAKVSSAKSAKSTKRLHSAALPA